MGNPNIGNIESLKNKNLIDQDGLQTRELFLYQITNHKQKGFIKEQTLSILHIKPAGSIIAGRAEEETVLTQENKANNSKGNTASITPRTSGMSYSTETHIEDTGNVYLASFEQINIDNGKVDVDVFFIDNIQRQMLTPKEVHGKKGKYNPTDFTLTNVKDVMNNYNALKFLYTFDDVINEPNLVRLHLDNYTLLSKVMAKGKVEGREHQDIDLKQAIGATDKMSLLTFSPVSTNYKLSLFSHWLDANRTLAFVKAETFLTKTSLKTLFVSSNADFKGWDPTTIEDAYKVIIGMLKLTQAYATNFSEYRIAPDNKVNPDAVINGIKLVDFVDKTPINAIDGMVEAWKGKYPSQVDTAGFKVLLECIIMLSNHINSSYAIGKGNNDFHKVYLPWYFVPQDAIQMKLADDADFNVILKSEYFDLTGAFKLKMLDYYNNFSGYLANDLNGWISQPELPNKLSPINKFARAGDVDLKSDNDLKYLFYIPYDNEQVLKNLYGELHTTTTTGWHDEGFIRNYSDTKTVGTSELDIRNSDLTARVVRGNFGPLFANNHLQNFRDEAQFTPLPEEVEWFIQLPSNGKVKAGSIKNIFFHYTVDKGSTYHDPRHRMRYYRINYEIRFDYELEIDGSQTISSIQHKGTIYDKTNWRSVANSLTNGKDYYSLELQPDYLLNFKVDSINEINLQALWLDRISLTLSSANGPTLYFQDIDLPTTDDETLSNFTILV